MRYVDPGESNDARARQVARGDQIAAAIYSTDTLPVIQAMTEAIDVCFVTLTSLGLSSDEAAAAIGGGVAGRLLECARTWDEISGQ